MAIEPISGVCEPLVSVIMPCLNEAEGVGVCVEKALRAMAGLGVDGEVVVVDNGSTDGSPEIAAAAGARVVHETRRGYGSAYLRGFQEARGRYLVIGDADDTYDFTDIGRFLKPLVDDGADLVMGSRLKGTILPGAMPWSHRWIGNPILSGMLRLLFGTRVSDSHCGMRALTRDAYERMHLRTTGMEFASEMVVNALRENLKIHEIPITYHPRIGESKLSGVRDAWRHVRFMLLFSPSYLFQLPGLLLMLVGAFLVAALAGGPRVLFGHRWDYHPLLFGAAALILGYNLMLFDLLAKTFSMGAGFARPNQWLERWNRFFTLEKGLIAGGLLFLAGLGLEAKIVWDWVSSGYGPLMAVRGVVIGMTAMVLGMQTVFASFLLSLMLIKRR
ncbi:MAG TPA: glycosyltransferase family 2 protein [Thermoanaerobaculia bacterium]|nr:glycosyltransferase family 2 protein [Thermoanaerobaculia bacterium]